MLVKVVRVMKLSIVLFFLTIFQVQAKDVRGQNVNLNLNQTEIRKVLTAVEKQSGVRFLYNYELRGLRRRVDFAAANVSVYQALDQLLGNSGLRYKKINENLIAIISEDPTENRNLRITGKVTGANNEPLNGVSVSEKGTSNGTITGSDGSFSLTVQNNAVLLVSFIGYQTQEVPVNGQQVVNIKLASSFARMDEVVVVGYGQQRRAQVTGAISSVKADELTSVSNARIEQVLQGRTSGVSIFSNSGSPGAGMRIRIRGTGSNLGAEPLYIVDGVRTGGIDNLDPAEVASIEVLKDAASAAIYGSAAANGVILITTKTGRKNTSEIAYSGQYGQQTVGNLPKMMTAQQYVQYLTESNTPGAPTQADLAGVQGTGTNWFDEVFTNAPITRHSLTFSGGSERSTYLLNGNYFSQEGIMGGSKSKFDRYTIRINSDQRLKSWLNVGQRLSYANIRRRGVAENDEFGSVMSSALSMDPLTPVVYTGALPAHVQAALGATTPGGIPIGNLLRRDPNGYYYGISNFIRGEYGNPVARLELTHADLMQHKVEGNIFADIEPFKGFKFTSRFGVDGAFQREHGWTPTYWFSSERLNTEASGWDNQNNWFSWQWENFANYNRRFGDHNLGLMVGTSANKFMWNYIGGSYSGLFKEEDLFSYADAVPNTQDRIGSNSNSNTLLSYFGRLNYDYKGKYIASATLRRDGASVFADGNKWGTFPAVSLGWILSNESFYGSALSNKMNYVKLRASWGRNGSTSNVGIGTWQASISSFAPGYLDAAGNYLIGAAPTNLSNPELTWETSEQLDFGADLSFFNNRLTLTVDRYKKTTKDLLTPGGGAVPVFVGNTLNVLNSGEIENTGWEFELSYRDNAPKNGFHYDIGLNASTLKNKVTQINPNISKLFGAGVGTGWTASMFEVGYPVWYFSGYKTDGIFQTQADVTNYLTKTGITGYNPKPGDPIVLDVNGDKQISSADQTFIGSPHPKFIYGGRVNLSYKGFDLLVFVQGQQGNDILMAFNRTDRPTANKPAFFFEDRWTGAGSTNSWFRASTSDPFVYNSDLMVFNGSYARIKQLQLGYSFPQAMMNRAKLKGARIYVSLDDFFTFTKYPGLDPEGGSGGANSIGIDRGVYPLARKALVGLSFNF